jgi:hypothetical protein
MMEAPLFSQNGILCSVVKVSPFFFPNILYKMKVVIKLNYYKYYILLLPCIWF